MKTFEDLEFKIHPVPTHFNKQAVMRFDNNYGISVINGKGAYCGIGTFEVAVTFNGSLTYSTPITDYVLSHQSEEDITEVMRLIQSLN